MRRRLPGESVARLRVDRIADEFSIQRRKCDRWATDHRDELSDADPDVPEIGDEIAVARPLVDLGHRLLTTAAADLRAVTHETVRLTR